MEWIILSLLGAFALGGLIGHWIGVRDGFNQCIEKLKLEQAKKMWETFMRKDDDNGNFKEG